MSKIKAFFDRKGVKLSAKRYFVDAMGSMALGLFATLLIGTIFETVGQYTGWEWLTEIAGYAKGCTGAALGIAIAHSLKAPPLVMLSAAVVGMMGNGMPTAFGDSTLTAGPAGAFVACVIAIELGKLVSKETPVDIIVTPVTTILSGALAATLLCPLIAYGMYWLGYGINTATELQPLLMGVLVSVAVGMVLTLPISSAAICAMIGISGLAGGAAVAGCCAQMVGFAVISFSENRWSGLVAQGLGTSMLQIGNIARKPVIWLAPTLASAILGPVSTVWLGMTNNALGAGMGTAGLVGPLAAYATMSDGVADNVLILKIVLLYFVAPALISLLINTLMRRMGWVKPGDMKL